MSESRQTVLIIDDNDAVRTALELLLSLHGLRAVGVASPESGLARLQENDIDVVVQDMNFAKDTTSGTEGVQLFHQIRANHPQIPIVLLTAWSHLESAVELVKAGAADYVSKPWDDARLLTSLRNLLQLKRVSGEFAALERERRDARNALAANFNLCGAVYESDQMHALVQMATQVSRSDVSVLLTGPNGVGKEILAEIVQANSSVQRGPFVRVNVGALPADLVESELFGAEAGAYTGATYARTGRFEAADGGTLFLDEIGNLSLNGQAKLLRVLQTGEFQRLGSTQTRRSRVRIISATNTDLRAAIARGAFREDLYYRINVIELAVPPLAKRPKDILPLARAFLGPTHQLEKDAEAALLAHSWPGNVRELQNAIKRACLLSPNRYITAQSLGLETPPSEARLAVREPDRREIERALNKTGGVVARAARELGLSRQALYRRMDRLGIREAAPAPNPDF